MGRGISEWRNIFLVIIETTLYFSNVQVMLLMILIIIVTFIIIPRGNTW